VKINDFSESVFGKAFIDGNVDYNVLYDSIKFLSAVDFFITTKEERVIEQIKKTITQGLHSTGLVPEFYVDGNIFNVYIGEIMYKVDLEKFIQKDFNYEVSEYVITDTIIVDEYFHNSIIDVLKQVGADNNLGLSFSLFTKDNYPFRLSQDEYNKCIYLFPFLDMGKTKYYLNVLPFDYRYVAEDIGTSFDFEKTNYFSREVILGRILFADYKLGTRYVSTHKKREFIDLVKNEMLGFKIDSSTLEYLEENIDNQLLDSQFRLLDYVDNVKISISRMNFEIEEQFKDLKDVYPSIYYYFGNQCEGWQIRKNSSGGNILKTKSNVYKFGTRKELIILCLKLLDYTDHFVVKRVGLASLSENYYILRDDQRKALNKFFGSEIFLNMEMGIQHK